MIEIIAWLIVGLLALFFGLIALAGIAMIVGAVFGVPFAAIIRATRK